MVINEYGQIAENKLNLFISIYFDFIVKLTLQRILYRTLIISSSSLRSSLLSILSSSICNKKRTKIYHAGNNINNINNSYANYSLNLSTAFNNKKMMSLITVK